MRRTWFTSGDYNAICDVCGFKRKASQIVDRWDGLKVCSPSVKKGCWEIRHPQDMIRPITDQQALPWTRPESADLFVGDANLGGCTIIGSQGVSGVGIAGCAIASRDYGIR